VLIIAGHQTLASETIRKIARVMSSPRYRAIFPQTSAQCAATRISLAHGGSISVGIVGQQISGRGADIIIIDDPISPSRAQDDEQRKAVNTWFDSEVQQRLNNRSLGAIVLVMQRVHSDDLAGHISNFHEEYEKLVLPVVATSAEEWILADGRRFNRINGDVWRPGIDALEEQLQFMKNIGPYIYATQYLQDTCGSENIYIGLRYADKPADWCPENWSIKGGFVTRYYLAIIMHRAFGYPLPERYSWRNREYPLSEKELEAAGAVHTRRMEELERNPDSGKSWMKPLDPAIFG